MSHDPSVFVEDLLAGVRFLDPQASDHWNDWCLIRCISEVCELLREPGDCSSFNWSNVFEQAASLVIASCESGHRMRRRDCVSKNKPRDPIKCSKGSIFPTP